MTLAFHFVLRLVDGRVILGKPRDRADAYRRMLRIGGRYGLLFFHLGVDHIHAVLACPREAVPRFAQAIESSIKQGTGREVGFGRYYVKPVADQGHLRALLAYVLQQEKKHGTALDPRHIGSNGPDLAGGRVTGARQRDLLALMLPRFRADVVERILLDGATRAPLEGLGPAPAGLTGEPLEELLRDAALSAIGETTWTGRRSAGAAARRALLEIVEKSELGTTVSRARLLECQPQSLARIRARPIDVEVGACVRWQIEFFVALATRER